MNMVAPEERSSAAGITQQGKLIGTAIGPALGGAMLRAGWLSAPFVIGGALKIAYDLAIYAGFRRLERQLDEQS
jgi:MFS family permease